MDNLPANTGATMPAARPSALDTIKGGTLRTLGKARTEAGEAIHAAGVSVEKLHRRGTLIVAGLILMLFLGALFRSLGMLWVNYVLIALFGLGALYAFLQPVHMPACCWSVAAWRWRAIPARRDRRCSAMPISSAECS